MKKYINKLISNSVDGRPSSKESSWSFEEGIAVTAQSLQTLCCLNLALFIIFRNTECFMEEIHFLIFRLMIPILGFGLGLACERLPVSFSRRYVSEEGCSINGTKPNHTSWLSFWCIVFTTAFFESSVSWEMWNAYVRREMP